MTYYIIRSYLPSEDLNTRFCSGSHAEFSREGTCGGSRVLTGGGVVTRGEIPDCAHCIHFLPGYFVPVRLCVCVASDEEKNREAFFKM